ncbi:MAG TPA: hypothetical protein VKH43_04540, partial [Thermoanaerobaculia bacterium]|nr:hypothetical protein [Thermoanaerobaculia bacterium]
SPDGRLVVSMNPSDNRSYSLLPTGAGEAKRITFDGLEDRRRAVFLPNGRELIFLARRTNGPLRLYVGSVEGGKARPVTPEVSANGFTFSSDGNAVAVFSAQRALKVYSLRPGEESKELRAVPGAEAGDLVLQWSADGRGFYVRRRSQQGSARIFRIDIETGRSELWKEILPADPAGARITTVWLTPDAKFYAYSVSRTLSQLYLVDGIR